MISKELYIEVFRPDTSAITLNEYDVILEDETLYLRNRHTLFDADEICVYKAAHKCKEWAWIKYNYEIKTQRGYDNDYEWYVYSNSRTSEQLTFMDNDSDFVYTEPEAIFKACEWILKETK